MTLPVLVLVLVIAAIVAAVTWALDAFEDLAMALALLSIPAIGILGYLYGP